MQRVHMRYRWKHDARELRRGTRSIIVSRRKVLNDGAGKKCEQ